MYPSENHTYNYFLDIFAVVILGIYVFPRGVSSFWLWKNKKVWYHHTNAVVKRYLKASENYICLLNKSIRFIQEMELINRGFTMVSNVSPIARLEQNSHHLSQRQCPQLREAVFISARDIMLSHKEITCAIIRRCPLISEVDSGSNYIANITLDEYGPCLSLPAHHSEKLAEVTDNFSLSAIKAMTNLCEMQTSEFLRRVAMCHIKELLRKEPSSMETIVCQISPVILNLCEHIEKISSMLLRSYNYYKCSSSNEKPERTVKNVPAPYKGVAVAVHSFELHLLALLKKVREIDEEINYLPANSSEILKRYSQLKLDLDSCQGCYDEGLSSLEKEFSDKMKYQSKKPDSSPLSTEEKGEKADPVPIFEMGKPVVVDEVFEGYTDPTETEDTSCGYDLDLSPEELAQKKREKAEALRMLTELKTVMCIRATEREARESKALEKMKLNSPDDASGPSLAENPDYDYSNPKDPSSLLNNIGYDPEDFCMRHNKVKCDCKSVVHECGDENPTKEPMKFPKCINDKQLMEGVGGAENEIEMYDESSRTVEERVGDYFSGSGISFAFNANIAAMAAARSQSLNLKQETFGESDDDDINDEDDDAADNNDEDDGGNDEDEVEIRD